MSISESDQDDLLDQLAEEFAARFRRGERPSLKEYTDRHPNLADEISELFPAMVKVEQAKEVRKGHDTDEVTGDFRCANPLSRQIGDYRILREIGRGGMGVVYEAEQVSLGRRVALKVLPGQVSSDRLVQERFRREARAAARLHHTNIVPVYDVGQDGDVCFYAMQFIQGLGLEAVIAELRQLLDRARSQSKIKTASDHRSHQRREERSGQGVENPTVGARVEVSAVMRSLLTGRFDPSGASPDQPGATRSTLAGTVVTPAGIGIESRAPGPDAALARTDIGSATAGDVIGPQRMHPLAPVLSASASPSSSSAILPGGAQLSSVESGRRGFFRSLAQIGRQVAGGLAHAHARGIVHRDIKPSNLLLDTDGVVWIADFGLAKGEDEGLTQSGDILGTLRYMAPERFRGEGDARADVYALGLTLYELLTLRPGFDSSDRLKLIEQIKTQEPPKPRTVDTRIPRDLETIVLKATEKDPKARYQTAEAMGEDLGRFLADEPIRARQVSSAERYWRWARRNPVIAVLGGVLMAVLIATTLGSMAAAAYFRESARRETDLAGREQLARHEAIEERDKSRQLSAGLALDKGFALAHEGHADRGLLWMLEALKSAPDDAVELRRTILWNLGAWLGQVHKTLSIIDTGGARDYLSFSPDGRFYAAGFTPFDRAIATPVDLWDTASGARVSTVPGAYAPFAFRPDGKALIAYAETGFMRAVDLVTGRVLWITQRLPGDWGGAIVFSPDGSTVLATRHDKSASACLMQLDVVSGRQRGEPIRGWQMMAVAPDGRTVATGRIENGELYIDMLDLPSGRRKGFWRAGAWALLDLRFSPDGKSLYGAIPEGDGIKGFRGHFAQIWDSSTGKPTSRVIAGTSGAIYTPSADRLVTHADNRKLVRDAATGSVRGSGFPADSESAVHPDGRTIATAVSDNTVRLWQLSADAEPISSGGNDKQVSPTWGATGRQTRHSDLFWAGLRRDGTIAISLAKNPAEREVIRFSDPAHGRSSGRPARHYPGWMIRAFALSPDGRCFATGSNPGNRVAGEVRLWDASTGRLLLPAMPHTNWVSALAFQPDGKLLAAGDFNGLVRFWDTSADREIGRPLAQGDIVMSLAYSPDGKMLAVGLANDHTGKPGIRLWDTRTRQPIGALLPSTDDVKRIEFRPDGRALLAGIVNSTRLWDTTRGRALSEPMIDETEGGFTSDGRAFVTLGSDGTVKLRDAATGAVLGTLLTSTSSAICAAFRGDGSLIAVGFEDGTVRLCDLATSQPVGPARSMRHAVHHVAFTSDGKSVAAIDTFGESRTWPVPMPLQDEGIDHLTLRIEARTGLRMETGFAISRLGSAAWRERLEQLGRLDPAAAEPDEDPAWHEPMIREAEENGNAFAARWHIDRLIAARPDDWFLYARRARAWSLSDQFDRAAADYRQAERLGAREDVLDFQVHCAIDCTGAGRWAVALWYLDGLIAARPDDGTLREDRAAVYGKLGREAERQAELARVFELGADEGLVIPRAEQLGRAGRWAEAARLLARCGRTGPLSRELAQAWAIACLRSGDRAGYREACATDMACQGPEPTVVWNALSMASLFALGAEGLDDYQVPARWFERRLSAGPAVPPMFKHAFSNALGGLLLRAGRFDEAIERLNQGMAVPKEAEGPGDWAYLALAHVRKGSIAEARQWLNRLRASPPDSSVSFWDLQELALLRSEAESLLFDAEFPGNPFHPSGPG